MLLMLTGVAPKFDKLLESEVVIVGGRIQLLCIVKGQPAPTISWYVVCLLYSAVFDSQCKHEI